MIHPIRKVNDTLLCDELEYTCIGGRSGVRRITKLEAPWGFKIQVCCELSVSAQPTVDSGINALLRLANADGGKITV